MSPTAPAPIAWQLAMHVAQRIGARLHCEPRAADLRVGLRFARTAPPPLPGAQAIEPGAGGLVTDSKPLAGTHVLVIAARREVRVAVRDALDGMGLVLDFVRSVADAEAFCADGLPHVLVCEAALAGDRYRHLRAGIAAELPRFVFIEIDEQGRGLTLPAPGAAERTAHVGREAIVDGLPAALIHELSRPH